MLEAGAWQNSSILQRGVDDLDNTVPLCSRSLTALQSLWASEDGDDFRGAQITVGQAVDDGVQNHLRQVGHDSRWRGRRSRYG